MSQTQSLARRCMCIILVLAFMLPVVHQIQASEQQIDFRCAIKTLEATNPLSADQEAMKVLNLIYDSATKVDPFTGERIPYIAVGSANQTQDTRRITWQDCAVGTFGYCPESMWEDPDKPEIIIFYDFEDVYWHDGVQMNIRDIMFSLHVYSHFQISWLGNPIVDQAGAAGNNYSEAQWIFAQNIWESEDGSRAALRFVLQAPRYSVFEHYLSSIILPYHIWGMRSAGQMADNAKIWCDPEYNISNEFAWKYDLALEWGNPSPVGSGLFSWAGMSGDIITLKPWKNHFYKPGFRYYSYDSGIAPIPKIDSLSLHVYASPDKALPDLELNRIDYIAWGLSVSELDPYTGNLDLKIRTLKSTSMTYMGYNMNRESFGYIRDYYGPAPMGTDYGKPLRKAMAHCIDLATISAQSNPLARETTTLETFYSWKNASAPSYSFDPPEAVNILRKAGYLLDDPALPPGDGNWWSNPDSTPMGSGTDGKIQVLITESSYDPLRYRFGTMIVSEIQAIGINIELVPMSMNMLAIHLNLRDYDMCIVGQDFPPMYTARPELYYFGAFHSSNTESGPNCFGYSNVSYDRKIARGMDMTDLQLERTCVQDAMAAVAFDTPIVPLFYESNAEIYRIGSYDGLLDDGSGSMLNARSMASVFRQEKPALKAKFANSAMTYLSNATKIVTVEITDQNGKPIAGADVTLETSSGALLAPIGRTNAVGRYSTNFTAPFVQLTETYNNWESIEITILEATKMGYRAAPVIDMTVTVFPENLRPMSVALSVSQDVLLDSSASGEPGFAYLEVQVTDQSNIPIDGVLLQVSADGLALGLQTVRTDSGGTASIKLTTTDVEATRECTVTVNATRTGFIGATSSLTVTVMPYNPSPEQVQPPADNMVLPASVAVISVLAVGVAYLLRKRKNSK